MKKNVYYPFLLAIVFIFTSNLDAKSCSDVKTEFTKKITEMKNRWDKEEKSLDNMIEILDNQIVNLEKTEASTLVKINDKYENDRSKELEKVKKVYDTTLKNLANEEKSDQLKIDKADKKNENKRKTLVASKENLEKELAAFEPLKQSIFSKYEKEKEKIESEHEVIKMKNEDEDRKFQIQVAKKYQSDFDEFNKELEVWDKNEEKVKSEISAVDKEVEEYAINKAAEMEKKQNEIEKKRAKLQKTYDAKKDDPSAEVAYIKETDKLDMELTQQSSLLNAQLKKFRTAKLKEKNKKENEYKSFLRKKKTAKKSVDIKIKKAQKQRDKNIANRESLRKARDLKWKKEMLLKESIFKKEINDKYTKPRAVTQKKLDIMNNKITKMDDKIMSDRMKAANNLNKKKEKRENVKDAAKTVYKRDSDKIKIKYDDMIIAAKKKSEKTKENLISKRDVLLKKKESNKTKNQSTLNLEKEKYQKAMSTCKN